MGRTTYYGYNNVDRLISTLDPLSHTTSISYDTEGNILSTTDELGRITTYGYDANNRLIKSTDALGQQRTTGYDAVGNTVANTDELGQTTTYTYDRLDRRTAITDALGHATTYTYDAVGNRTQTADALGHTTKYVYDSLNRQIKVIDAKNQTTTTGYDKVGNVLAITDSVGNTTSYTYDAVDRQITDTNSLGKTRSYGYNAVGDLTSEIDRNGRKRTYDYDVLNRQTAEHWLDNVGTDIRTFNYSYDAVGHLLGTNDPDSKYTYTYDAIDRIKSVDNLGTLGVPNVLLNYSYDAAGNLLSVTDKISGVLKGTNAYTYDILNRATRITQSGTGVQSKRVDMSYDAVNRLTGLSRYGDLTGTLAVADSSSSYDAAGRLKNLTHKRGATTIASYGFNYDNANRITQSSGTDGTQDYTYDNTNQLTAVDHTTQADEAYSYDANGNRTSAGYGMGTNNQLLTDGIYNYVYDGEGNRTRRTEIASGKVTEYVWDYRNRLASVLFKDAGGVVTKTIEYLYDGDNQRIGKRIDGAVTERYVIDRNQIALVFDGAGVQTHRYLYGTGIDRVLADETPATMVWALADNQGTVKDLVDNSGVVVNHVTYDSFGKVVAQSNAGVGFRYGYTGREQDNETGLDYYRARYYDAGVGRFISEDSIGFNGGDANLYRYVGNSPTNFVDPSGNVGNNVNPLPGIDPNCLALALKKTLGKNPKCKEGTEFVPLTKERLEEIGRYAGVSRIPKNPKSGLTPEQVKRREDATFQANLGNAFENNILRSIQSASGNQYSKYRGGDFRSPSRIYETNGKKQFVNPDLTGELRVREVEVDRQTGAIIKNSVRDFKDSSIVEIKSARADITYKYDEYQTAGFLDFAENTEAYKAGYTPRLQYITVAGSRIDKDLIAKATKRGVALYQGVAIEKCSSSPGSIAVSKVILRNPSVYGNKNGRVIIPDGIAPSTIRSNFVEFRP